MSGVYFNPLKREFLNLSGGTVTGNTIFTQGVNVNSFSATTLYSGDTQLSYIISNIVTSTLTGSAINSIYLPLSGGTGGEYNFTGNTTGQTITVTDKFNINDKFIVSGDSGFISTYNGLFGSQLSGKFLSGTTSGFVVANISDIQGAQTLVQPGANTTTGGTSSFPTINLVSSPSVDNLIASGNTQLNTLSALTIYSGFTNLDNYFNQDRAQINTKANLSGATFTGPILATSITDSELTPGWGIYAGTGGILSSNSGFTYDSSVNSLFAQNLQIGSQSLSGTMTVWGNVLVMGGHVISASTAELYIEDNNIILNYNPTATTISTSLGAGVTIQDGSGIQGTDVYFDIRGTATTVDNRSFSTNLGDIRIRETGTFSNPNGVRVIAEGDILDAGFY